MRERLRVILCLVATGLLKPYTSLACLKRILCLNHEVLVVPTIA